MNHLITGSRLPRHVLRQTLTGADVDLMLPDPDTIHLEDIAWALAAQPRFTGHTRDVQPDGNNEPVVYSVAQHSIWVVLYLEEEGWHEGVQLAGLLHDAREAYLGDDSTPKKRAVEALAGWDVIEALARGLDRAIMRWAGLPYPWPEDWRKAIKDADMVALATERRDFTVPGGAAWDAYPTPEPHPMLLGEAMPQDVAAQIFIEMFNRLKGGAGAVPLPAIAGPLTDSECAAIAAEYPGPFSAEALPSAEVVYLR